jgi:tellurite resistance protein TerA
MAINLGKITLEKTHESTRINLTKGGDIKVSLRWNRSPVQPKKGLFASLFGSGSGEIDLDLGVCVETTEGVKYLLDPLQGGFQRGDRGSLTSAPYVLHSGDDRAGGGGEVLLVSGSSSTSIRQIWVYTFIYEGVARWGETDAVVTIEAPGQAAIEIPMGRQTSSDTFCALAHLTFQSGSLDIKRLVTFHDGHLSCDQKYGWGFTWERGSK